MSLYVYGSKVSLLFGFVLGVTFCVAGTTQTVIHITCFFRMFYISVFFPLLLQRFFTLQMARLQLENGNMYLQVALEQATFENEQKTAEIERYAYFVVLNTL